MSGEDRGSRETESDFRPCPPYPFPYPLICRSCNSNQINPGPQRPPALRISSGDHTGKETPVPIPNTAVKLSGPMIVPTSAKVGIARFYFAALPPNPADCKVERGFFWQHRGNSPYRL